MSTGILLTNIGSPDEPTEKSVRDYLKRFLTDKHVVSIPSFLWYPILYGIILPFRSKYSAKLYQSIWTEEGAPLTIYSQKLADKLQQRLQTPVAFGTHYGKPSIADALETLRAQSIDHLIVLPLFPQFSRSTTPVTFDLVNTYIANWQKKPNIQFINNYATNPEYINAIANTIKNDEQSHEKAQYTLFSFHGIPVRSIKQGDPYIQQCQQSAKLIADACQLQPDTWSLAFQSRLSGGWARPFTDQLLQELPQKGITNLRIICPGFAVDCLETLEEIVIRSRQQFLAAGGKQFHYIPALNDSDEHINMLVTMLRGGLPPL